MIQLHTSTKHKWQNTDQTPAPNSCLNFNFKILTKPCAHILNKSLPLWPNLSFKICNKLLPTRSSSLTSATVTTTSTSFEKASSHARVTSIKFTKQELVSELVSQSVSDKSKQWSDSSPIKIGIFQEYFLNKGGGKGGNLFLNKIVDFGGPKKWHLYS